MSTLTTSAMKRKVILFLCILLSSAGLFCQDEGKLSKEQLIEDTRQLMSYIEDIHPDPYLYSGGKVAFNRRFQDILQNIPTDGAGRDTYIRMIRPLVASVSDGHTRIASYYEYDPKEPGGIPLSFGSVEEIIYVDGVARESDRHLIGARVLEVEGVSTRDMITNLSQVEGIENVYHGLLRLRFYLKVKPYLQTILPGWTNNSRINVRFELPNGKIVDKSFDLPVSIESGYLKNESAVSVLPPMESRDFIWFFTGPKKETAILKIDELTSYREMFESLSVKREVTDEMVRVYERYNGEKAPDDFNEIMAGIPSAVEMFREMVTEMKSAGTKNLVIDLSKNGGGNSLMADILTYFLYGKPALAYIIADTPPVKKYSEWYFQWQTGKNIESLNREYSRIQSYQITSKDYDFSTERYVQMFTSGRLDTLSGLKLKYRNSPSFLKEIESGTYEKYYTPGQIVVACSNGTYSSAFTMLRYLEKSGAVLVGSTSGQSGNGFGNIIYVTLPNSGIRVAISHDAYMAFPANPGERMVLIPDHTLTWDKLRKYKFDPNSELRFALEVAEK